MVLVFYIVNVSLLLYSLTSEKNWGSEEQYFIPLNWFIVQSDWRFNKMTYVCEQPGMLTLQNLIFILGKWTMNGAPGWLSVHWASNS